MVNKHEKIYFVISISEKQLFSFLISLTLSFYSFLIFSSLSFHFNFVVHVFEWNMHIFFADISGRNFLSSFRHNSWVELFFQVGGGGYTCTQCTPPCIRTYTLWIYWSTKIHKISSGKDIYTSALSLWCNKTFYFGLANLIAVVLDQ